MTPKLIAVCGATGQQGGSVLQALQELKLGATIRALTRNPDSAASKALAAPSVEVKKADFEDPASLRAAFEGCDAVFGVTDFWKACALDMEREIQQGKNLVDAAKAAGVKHFIWSSLEDTRPELGKLGVTPLTGDCTVPHFDGKAQIEQHLRKENLLPGGGMEPNKQPDGSFALFVPTGDAKLAWCAVADIGRVAAAVIAGGPGKFAGQVVPVVGDLLSLKDVADVFSRVFGQQVKANSDISPADWSKAVQSFGMPSAAADDLANMFLYFRTCDIQRLRPLEGTRAVCPSPQSMESFLAQHKRKFADLFV